MSMNNLGKLTTFYRLIQEESVIMIPKVQRDYAYGRKEKKVEAVLNGMLVTMFEAVRTHKSVIFDCIYGGSFVKKNDKVSGLIPLDGQQRLTTLYLLHYYASIVQTDVSDCMVECLKKFRYETRQSATDFCDSLVDDIRHSLIENYQDGKRIKELIKDNPKYLPSYDSDPTIISMLNVLEKIEEKHNAYKIENLWTQLTEYDDIQFYALSLEKFGLTDDLYIKMNSRGKKLTEFEIFKSDLEKAINKISPNLKDEFSQKIDNNWMDVLWAYAQSCEEEDIVKKADDGFMCLFNNVFRIEMFRRGIESQKKRTPSIVEIITNEQAVRDVMAIFDMLFDMQVKEGIQAYWDRYFYFSDNVVGENDLIRLFWQQTQNRKPVFYLAMDRDLSVPEMVYFYAIYCLFKYQKDEVVSAKCLRVVRNLITANVRANSARYDMLSGFISDVEEVVANDGDLCDGDHTFVSTTCTEERYKATTFSPEIYKALLKYENHQILQGSLMLFIEHYFHGNSTENELLGQLEHFEAIFNNRAIDNFDKIRINLIDSEKDYMQYEPSMIVDEMIYRCFFIHCWNDFSHFFIKNERRRNQEAILDIVANKLHSIEDLKVPIEKCKEFRVNTWQYYLAKYNSANRTDTRYGCYAWDDKENKPLEIIILNSSYHSIYNIEWKMLNHILMSELWDNNVKYSLDPHASHPFVMNKCPATLTITQNGWQVHCDNQEVFEKLSSNKSIIVISNDDADDSYTYIVDISPNTENMDYIDLAKVIVKEIENFYNNKSCCSKV